MPLPDAPSLLNKDAVCGRLGLSARCLENMVRDGQFPPPVRLGRFVYWSEAAVIAWQQQMFAAQEAWVVFKPGAKRRLSQVTPE
jgi:prophage regulatory protein